MSSTHCIVVWEWQSEGQWLPHTPGVTRTLERAHAKKLTRVVLADADPALNGHYVNLRTLTQCVDLPDGTSRECLVRRAVYDAQSAGARGVRWEWAPAARAPADADYEPMPMELQCLVEAAYVRGEGAAWGSWRLSPRRLAAAGPRGPRRLRRALLPPYPRAPPAPPPPPPPHPGLGGGGARIPQQHTGSSVVSVRSQPARPAPAPSPAPAPARAGARSASPPRKHNLARQILHNLNIFSSSRGGPPEEGAGARAGRRHSVDTVSTYLSHESKDSLQAGSVGELLDCSAGSDDVFHPPPDIGLPASEWAEAGVEAEAEAEAGAAWGAVCGACVRRLRAGAPLRRPPRLPPTDPRDELYIECLICGEIHDKEGGGRAGEAAEGEGVNGPQPSGSMAWSVQPTALAAFPAHATILVTYTFQSGVQAAGHPRPGAPYYAVGFPRHSLLPDNRLGREVLWLLRGLWACGRLFGVSASRTTGREHVVRWRAPAPPAAPRHYPPQPRAAAAHLRALAHALRRLLQPAPAPPAPA